jgi:hypothetical protein
MDRERAQTPELKEGQRKQWPVEGKSVAYLRNKEIVSADAKEEKGP